MTLRALLGSAYRAGVTPFGRRALRRMAADALPERLHAPLRFLLDGRAPATARAIAARIERRRAELLVRPETFRFEYAESGTGRWAVCAAGVSGADSFDMRWLAGSVSVSSRWGIFLRLCAEAFEARQIVELGACVGISGAYLASASSRPNLVTLDGSPALAEIARATLAEVTDRATVVQGPFDATLPRALADVTAVDLAFVDGHHDEMATLQYVASILPHLSRGSLLILDDIRLSVDMWRAWRKVVAMPGFTAAVDVGRFGLLVWEGGDVLAKQYDLARYTGWWPLGPPRQVSMAPRSVSSGNRTH